MGQAAACCSSKSQRKKSDLKKQEHPEAAKQQNQTQQQRGDQDANRQNDDQVIVSLKEIQKSSNQGTEIRKDQISGSANSKEILDNYLEAIKQSNQFHSGKGTQKQGQRDDDDDIDGEQEEPESDEEQKQRKGTNRKIPANKVRKGEPKNLSLKNEEKKRQSHSNLQKHNNHHTHQKEEEFVGEHDIVNPNDIPIIKGDAIEEDNEGDGIIEDQDEDIFAQGDAIIEQYHNQIQKTASQKKKNQNPYYIAKVRSSFKEDEDIEVLGQGQPQQTLKIQDQEGSLNELELKEDEAESESCYSEFAEEKIFKENQNASLQLYASTGQLQNPVKSVENKPKVQSTVLTESKKKSLMRASAGKLSSVPKIALRQSQVKEGVNVLPQRQSVSHQYIHVSQIEVRVPTNVF